MDLHEFFTPPVIWFLVGVVLLLLELAIPGLIIIFFGAGAWITALCIKIFHIGINMQLLIFLISSLLFLVLLRRYLKEKFFGESSATSNDETLEDEFIGKIALAETDLLPEVKGKISFKGTIWSAISDTEIKSGESVKIIDKESITLFVTKK